MKLDYKKIGLFGAALLLNTTVNAAVGLETVCVSYTSVASTTVGIKLPAKVNLWKGNTLCGTLYIEPGSSQCYYPALTASCKTSATAATTVTADNLYVNNVVFIPESAPYALTGTSGTTGIENINLTNGAPVATAAVPSVITAGTLFVFSAGSLIPS
jgi:hypothetical protein